jgi:hypothetical protein
MQIFSLKYYWSKILNPYVTKKDYYTVLANLNNLFQGNYSSNIDTLLTNSNPLKLHLFSPWRGENGYIEYQTKLRNRFLQNEMPIKEAILFSNPLLKEILDSQSLIYPYSIEKQQINERLALFYNKTNTKLTLFNEAVKSIRRSGSRTTTKPVGLEIDAAFASGKLNSINLWQSLVPAKLNNLNKDYINNEILVQNTTLKYIFNKNLPKLNLILFLIRFKKFISISLKNRNISYRNFPISFSTNSSTQLSNFTLNKCNIRQILQYNWLETETRGKVEIFQPDLEFKLYKYNKRLENIMSVYNTSLTSVKDLKNIIILDYINYMKKGKLLPFNFNIIRINNNLIFKEVNEDTKNQDMYSLDLNQIFKFTIDNYPEKVKTISTSTLKHLALYLSLSLIIISQDKEKDRNIN